MLLGARYLILNILGSISALTYNLKSCQRRNFKVLVRKRFIGTRSIQMDSSVYQRANFLYYKCDAPLKGEIYEKWSFKIVRELFLLGMFTGNSAPMSDAIHLLVGLEKFISDPALKISVARKQFSELRTCRSASMSKFSPCMNKNEIRAPMEEYLRRKLLRKLNTEEFPLRTISLFPTPKSYLQYVRLAVRIYVTSRKRMFLAVTR